jgi:hypothetical protein
LDISDIPKDLLPYLPIFIAARSETPALKFPYTEASHQDKRYNWPCDSREVEFMVDDEEQTAVVTVDEDGFERVPRELVTACVEYVSAGNSYVLSYMGGPQIVQNFQEHARDPVFPQLSMLEIRVSRDPCCSDK